MGVSLGILFISSKFTQTCRMFIEADISSVRGFEEQWVAEDDIFVIFDEAAFVLTWQSHAGVLVTG